MQISRIRLSDKTSRRLSRVTPSAASEHHVELIGCPISVSFATFCVCLELRPLPSAGVTRFPRYYEPLRHPTAPGLSLTGVRLVIPDQTALWGFPCCARFPCVRAAASTLVQRLGVVFAHLAQPHQPSPKLQSGRPAGAFAGWDLHPLESAAFSRRTRKADIGDRFCERLNWVGEHPCAGRTGIRERPLF